MSKSTTPRLGLSLFSADTDNHGGRPQHNEDHQALEEKVALWAGRGLLSARPSATIPGRIYVSTNQGDGGQASLDLGDKWLDLSTVGGGGAGNPVIVEGTPTEGTSARAARADHAHALPLATADRHGAMASQWAELMESASFGGTPWSLTIRDGAGRVRLGADPAHGKDAATKDSSEAVGTAGVVGNAIVRRWGGGHVSGPDPDKPEFYATRRYVDARTSRREWKTDIRELEHGLNEVAQLDLYSWTYRDDAPATGSGQGPMVEQVAALMPELTTAGDDGRPERILDRDYLWTLTKAVQELADARAQDRLRIDELEGTVRRLTDAAA